MSKGTVVDKRAELLERITPKEAQRRSDGTFPDIPEFADPFPLLNAFFVVSQTAAGPRKTPTLTLWMEPEGVRCVVNDRENKRKAWFVASSIGSLWAEIDSFLSQKDPRWMNESGVGRKRSK